MPSGVTEVEKKAVEEATYAAGAREVHLIEEPVAAAIGAGIDIAKSACDAKEYGFDGVLLHFGHGWLPAQFLSPLSHRAV